MTFGMTYNGKCLTANILECPKTDSEFSLSDILEEQPDQMYFLSPAQAKNLLERE
jgi:hypothetical protein